MQRVTPGAREPGRGPEHPRPTPHPSPWHYCPGGGGEELGRDWASLSQARRFWAEWVGGEEVRGTSAGRSHNLDTVERAWVLVFE